VIVLVRINLLTRSLLNHRLYPTTTKENSNRTKEHLTSSAVLNARLLTNTTIKPVSVLSPDRKEESNSHPMGVECVDAKDVPKRIESILAKKKETVTTNTKEKDQ
jgi:hypothetical protein